MTRYTAAGRIALEYIARTALVSALLAILYMAFLISLQFVRDTFDGGPLGELWSLCFGFVIVLVIASAIAVLVGVVLGLIIGLVNGIVIGVLTVIVFFPLKDTRRYFLSCGVLGSLVSIFLTVAVTPLALVQLTRSSNLSFSTTNPSLALNNWLVLVVVPALLGGIANWWVCYHGVRSYVESTEKMEHS